MPPPGCPHCCDKWPITGGGVCTVCRTLDRLSAFCRGPQLPAAAQEGILVRLRTWIGELQDYSENYRGLVPCASGVPPPHLRVEQPPPRSAETPKEEEIEGATPKAAGPPPPPPAEPEPPRAIPKEETEPEPKEASSSWRSRPKEPEKKRSRSHSRRARKRSRKTRSPRRSPARSRRHLASPVRPGGSGIENPWEDNREELPRRKVRPRSPSYSPPRERARGATPSSRPVGTQWRGPIRARPREPPPGQGRHFQKNKGVSKRKRNREFWRGARPRGRRR